MDINPATGASAMPTRTLAVLLLLVTSSACAAANDLDAVVLLAKVAPVADMAEAEFGKRTLRVKGKKLRLPLEGLAVAELDPEGPLARAGIQPMDVLTKVNGLVLVDIAIAQYFRTEAGRC